MTGRHSPGVGERSLGSVGMKSLSCVAVLLLASGFCLSVRAGAPLSDAFLKKHCFDCHGDGAKKGELSLDVLSRDLSDAEATRRWTLVHDRVASGEMPPDKEDKPPAAETAAYLKSLSSELTTAHLARREVVLRRLNRAEYENTIRDLLDVHVDVKDLLPEEVSAQGFDNVGAALASSDALVQAYLDAADMAIDAAFGPEKAPKPIKQKILFQDVVANQIGKLFRKTDAGAVIFGSRYCPSAITAFRPVDAGTYRIRIQARGFQSEKPVVMSVHAGDVVVHRKPFHLVGYWALPPGNFTTVEFTDRFTRGETFHPKPYGTVSSAREKFEHPGPGVEIGEIDVEGPLEAWPPPSRMALLNGVDPTKGTLEDVRTILLKLLPRAFRRDVKPAEVEPFVSLAKAAFDAGRPFNEALRLGLKGLLCSPQFVFLDEPPAKKGEATRLGAFALASRLSYFLWSSMPDAALFDAARSGELQKADVLKAQVARMLKDSKAAAFTENFTGQWLDLRTIDATEPDDKLYPEYDEALKHAMLNESRLFFERVLKENRSVLEFVSSDWTILNERLAKHYEIPDVRGTEFRVVQLPKENVRGGVLTQASVLKVTANGTNTSPVLRGVWVLKNILGEPPPPPPPGVPAVEPDIRGAVTLRQQLEKHRDSQRCAACHAMIDPPGFALENFDVIGGHRTWYRSLGQGTKVDAFADKHSNVRVAYKKGLSVDATGEVVGLGKFDDIRAFKALMLKQPERIARGLTRKLLTYSTGRALGFSDRPEVNAIADKIAQQGYGFQTLVTEIALSESFHRP